MLLKKFLKSIFMNIFNSSVFELICVNSIRPNYLRVGWSQLELIGVGWSWLELVGVRCSQIELNGVRWSWLETEGVEWSQL